MQKRKKSLIAHAHEIVQHVSTLVAKSHISLNILHTHTHTHTTPTWCVYIFKDLLWSLVMAPSLSLSLGRYSLRDFSQDWLMYRVCSLTLFLTGSNWQTKGKRRRRQEKEEEEEGLAIVNFFFFSLPCQSVIYTQRCTRAAHLHCLTKVERWRRGAIWVVRPVLSSDLNTPFVRSLLLTRTRQVPE